MDAKGSAEPVQCAVTSLNLANNMIGAVGAQSIASALAKPNSTLKSLNLYRNRIVLDGARAFAALLQDTKNCALQELNVAMNLIGDAGVTAIAEALRVNLSLTSLSIGDNDFGVDAFAELCETLKLNPRLIKLDIRESSIRSAAAPLLYQALVCPRELGCRRNV